jgi:hypothetical protein
MSDDLQAQAQMGQQLVISLNSIISDSSEIAKLFEAQLTISSELNSAAERFSNNFVNLSSDLGNVSRSFEEAINTGQMKNSFNNDSRNLEKAAREVGDSLDTASSTLSQVADDEERMTSSRDRRTKAMKNAYKQRIIVHKEKNFFLRSLDRFFVDVTSEMKNLVEKFKSSPLVTRAVKTGGWSLLIDIPRMILTSLFKIIGSLIGMTTTFFKTLIALPLMLAKYCVNIGNAFREDIIVGIGSAYQATKEYADANSLIGQGISNLRGVVVGALKTFENPRSQLVKLFGTGAAGAQKFLTDVGKSIDDMGPLAELFGHQVTNSKESALYLVYATKGLGLTSKDVAYYALDAGVHLENTFDRLERVKDSIQLAAEMHSVDTKQVSIGMQKLRTNIKDFGHLSDQNLSNLVARMRQLNVGAEDLTSVFGKFKTLEDASKTSAMLYQSFEMNIDALSLLTAKDPGEIVDQFRDAMFATGKAYDDLNRHEKQLMQQTTGMSDAMLKSLMTYQNMGLSYAEAKQRVANDDPTKKQIDAIKGLTSSISEIKKVMTFTSPFQAFMSGLGKNAAASKKAKRMATALSKVYETLYLFGLHLDKKTIKSITTPVIIILNKINGVFKGKAFKNLLAGGTSIFSKVVSNVTGGISDKGGYANINKTLDSIYAIEKSGLSSSQKDLKSVRKKVQNLVKTGDKEVIKYLQKRNIIDDDKNFVKDVTLKSVLSQLKSASLQMSTKKGKASIKSINDSVYKHTASLLDDYFGVKLFEDNRGISGQIKQTTEGFKSLFKEGSGPLRTIFDLGRKMMGGIIKGAAIAFTVFLHILNGTVDKAYDNISSPIGNMISKLRGHKTDEKFTLLSWLGISKQDEGKIVDELAKSLGKLTTQSWKTLKFGGMLIGKLYGIFTDLARGLIAGLCSMLVDIYDNNNTSKKAKAAIWFFLDDGNNMARARALKQYGAGMGLKQFTQKMSDEMDQKTERGQAAIHGITLKNILANLKKKYKKGPYKDAVSIAIPGKVTMRSAMDMMKAIKKVKFYESKLSYDQYLRIKEKHIIDAELKTFKNIGLKELEPTKLELKAMGGYLGFGQKNDLDDKYAKPFVSRGINNAPGTPNDHNLYLIRAMKNATALSPSAATAEKFIEPLNSYRSFGGAKPVTIKDGFLESNINSILSQDGLKLFTSDGKIIVPHSMDELINLSGDDKEGLISVFANVGKAYREVATAVTVLKSEKGGFNREEYIASDDLIDDLMSLVYETLDIAINRDIDTSKANYYKKEGAGA